MSHIALILGADPKKSSGGPKIKLEEGRWELMFQGVETSTFTLASTSFTDLSLINLRPTFSNMVLDPGYHQIKFVTRGDEKSISIYAVPLAR